MANYKQRFNDSILRLAKKYYGTTDLSKLRPYQLDKLVQWTTGIKPDQGKNKSRKAEMALRKNKKYVTKKHHIHDEEKLYSNK